VVIVRELSLSFIPLFGTPDGTKRYRGRVDSEREINWQAPGAEVQASRPLKNGQRKALLACKSLIMRCRDVQPGPKSTPITSPERQNNWRKPGVGAV
jgi:hypothetical protein